MTTITSTKLSGRVREIPSLKGRLTNATGQAILAPTIQEDENNTDGVYKLVITDKNGSFTTPNLTGPIGQTGQQGEPGKDGTPGARGQKGDPFTYDDFTPEQLEELIGPQGPQGNSAYQVAVANGFEGTEAEWLASLKGADGTMVFEDLTDAQKEQLKGDVGPVGADGADGKSAYQVAVDNGFVGTQEEWLASLRGEKGADGTMVFEDLTEAQKEQLKGDVGPVGADGKSAYQVAVDNGFTGTQQEWLASLQGEVGPQGAPMTYDDLTAEQKEALKGDTGFSPLITVEPTGTGYDITITDQNGTKKVSVQDGAIGPQGVNGVSPTVSTQDTDTGVSVTITDATGEHTFTLDDGAQGAVGPAGKSAYEVAVAQGFVGNETQWLQSLKGEQGVQGEASTVPGPRGPSGVYVGATEPTDDNVLIWLYQDGDGIQAAEGGLF